jgi:hypothetical protein
MNADGVSAAGQEYHNQYHDLLEIRNGQIEVGREYLDTALRPGRHHRSHQDPASRGRGPNPRSAEQLAAW